MLIMKPGRNDPCPCGSGKKYKKCCEAKSGGIKAVAPTPAECSQLASLFNARRFAEVEALARSLIAQYSESGLVWKLLGSSLELQGKDGLSAFQRATELLPGDAQAHCNLGNALNERGRLDEAVASYRRAVKIKPDLAEAHCNLGIALSDLGRLEEAVASCRRALVIDPDFAGTHYNLGNNLKDLGRLDEAVASYRRAVAIKPDYTKAYSNLGIVLKDLGRLDEAVASFRRALAIQPDSAELHGNLGNVLKDELGRPAEALESYRRALEIKPDYIEAHYNLGSALSDLGQLDKAVASYRRALEIKPDYVEAYLNLGTVLKDLGQLDEAVTSYRRALAIKPDYAEAYYNLGIALKDLGQIDDAVASFRRALKINPDYVEAHSNLGGALKYLGQLDEGVASCRRALEIQPDNAGARWNMSLLLLALGRYTEAWPYHESRHDANKGGLGGVVPSLPYPHWQGESLEGKSLLLVPEQGFGDLIQFARYAPLLKARGLSRLTLVCAPPLKALLETAQGVDTVITDLASAPDHDYWAFPLSLPLHFGTTVDSIPAAIPYLHALPARLERWRDRLPTQGFKVGLVWKGSPVHKNDARRSLPGLSSLSPLWSVPGVTFVSLQKGQGEDEVQASPTDQRIIALGPEIEDFADTAAIVAQMDLVICVDTAIAHLAGALGKPCWVLLPAIGTDWRWLLDRTDSPWYPGVLRLFRQTLNEDWDSVVARLTVALAQTADGCVQ
jgi:tetratricopeptide (TPR) repeat protein